MPEDTPPIVADLGDSVIAYCGHEWPAHKGARHMCIHEPGHDGRDHECGCGARDKEASDAPA